MSANTKQRSGRLEPQGEWKIRSGALSIPLDFAGVTRPLEQARLREELNGITIPRNAESFIPAGSYLEVLARLDHISDKTAELLAAALSQDLSTIGLAGKAIVHAENLWSALQTVAEGIRYFQPGSEVRTRLRHGKCQVTYRHPFGDGPSQALDVQYSIGILCNVLFECEKTPAAGLRVHYPGARREHERLFRNIAIVSNSPQGLIEFDSNLLRCSLRRSTPAKSEMLLSVMAAHMEESDTSAPCATLVRSLQISSIEHQHRVLSQVEVASLLGLSVRMLQYKLKREHARFGQLRDESRLKFARQFLLEGQSIARTAHSLGFAHRQSFSEAFSNWQGMSPSEFRSRGRVPCP